MELKDGSLLGPYRIESRIGAGGMGEVYRAHDDRLDRDVAIKVLPGSVADDPDRLARFEREAKAIAALSHPNILAIFDVGIERPADRSSHPVAYAVTELLEGDTLRERLDDGALSVRKTVEIAVQIARGLAAAHEKNLVHRDLKPENIFLLRDGQVKILDFGLARQASASSASGTAETVAAVTDPGTVLGTFGYMAPEQVRGQLVDGRTDLFAFGAVLHEMLSGQRAFGGATAADTMTAVLKEEPAELAGSRAEISPALDRIVRHCLEKNPAERFQSARDVAFALEALSGATSSSGVAAVLGEESARSGRRLGLGAVSGVVLALAVGWAAGYFGGGARGEASASVTDVTYQPVTFDEGFVFAARFAQDGRTIVFSADWEDQARDIYVTSVDSPESRPLGLAGTDLLALSPTGDMAVLDQSVVLRNPYYRTGTLARASLTGGAVRPELVNVQFADVAPDGEMAVVREESGRTALEYPVGHVLAEGSIVTPRVSPSGAHVAAFFLGGLNDPLTVRIYQRGGTLVAESRGFPDWWSLAWRSDDEVWFAATEVRGSQTAVFAMGLDGRDRVLFRAPGALTVHDVSLKGELLASFDQYRERVETRFGDAERPIDRSWKEGARPVGLSTGHVILLNQIGDSGGPEGSAYAWSPGAAEPVKISEGNGMALSPDGRAAVVRTGGGLVSVPTGAGRPTPIEAGDIANVTWSGWLPDGRLILGIARVAGTPGALVVAPSGGAPVALLPEGFMLGGGNLISPDGTQIAAIDPEGQGVTCLVATAACEPIPGWNDGEQVAGWSADNASVFVYTGTDVPVQVDRLDIDTGQRAAWRSLAPLQAAVSSLRVVFAAPDGGIVYSYSRARTQLYVIRGLR